MLGDLGNHGGLTLTHALLSEGPVIGAFVGEGIWIDQRGVPRPQGGLCDAGLVERCPQDGENTDTIGSELP